MEKIIKVENTPDADSFFETLEYASFGGNLPSGVLNRAERQRMEDNEKTLAICSMIYGLRFIEADDARKGGFQSGYEEAQEKVREEMQGIIDSHTSLHEALKIALHDIASMKEMILAQAEDGIIQLVIAIAKKLLCRELEEHPDAIIDIVKKAIKESKTRDEIIIRISPGDYAILEQRMSELKQSLEHTGEEAASIRIEESADITPGGCIVETDTNIIDMSLETRMESVFSSLDT